MKQQIVWTILFKLNTVDRNNTNTRLSFTHILYNINKNTIHFLAVRGFISLCVIQSHNQTGTDYSTIIKQASA